MRSSQTTLSILAAFVAVGTFVAASNAAVITISNTMPTVSGPDIASTGGTSTEKWFAGSGASNGLGQTFLTGNDAGYTISAFSMQVSTTSEANVGAMSFTLRVGTLSGTTFTPLATTTNLSKPANTAWSAGDWFTFTFDSPVALSPNTTYAVDVEMNSAGDWHGGIPYMYYKNSDVYADGIKYSFNSGDTTTVSAASSQDRAFVVDLATVVPEPASLAMGLLGLTMLLVRRR
jgi:hypothetical protein